jgi:hypothetical protein
LIFLNISLIVWLLQKQPTIVSSAFGAEFVAMKHGVEALLSIRYKLCIIGMPIGGPTYVYGNIIFVIHNTQQPELTLKRRICPSATTLSTRLL